MQSLVLASSARAQNFIIDYYSKNLIDVVLTKKHRMKIWNNIKRNGDITYYDVYKNKFPALFNEISSARIDSRNVQSAIFSECVYAQKFAELYQLACFEIFDENGSILIKNDQYQHIINIAKKSKMTPRYIYYSTDQERFLIQAGGPNAVDSVYIDIKNEVTIYIEFKESVAKTSEIDLPKYTENGNFVIDSEFTLENIHFSDMLKDLETNSTNFWESMGSNIHEFKEESVIKAVLGNYGTGKKFADFIVTEDAKGKLTLIPIEAVIYVADIVGEVRPAGRNAYKPFTPEKLKEFILEQGGSIICESVTMPKNSLKGKKQRGGSAISRYKINSIFFLRSESIAFEGDIAKFNLGDVLQVKATISAHMRFKKLSAESLRVEYLKGSEYEHINKN